MFLTCVRRIPKTSDEFHVRGCGASGPIANLPKIAHKLSNSPRAMLLPAKNAPSARGKLIHKNSSKRSVYIQKTDHVSHQTHQKNTL